MRSSDVGTERMADPIFQRKTPLLFAHRGGAREVEESTIRGFEHAIAVSADVLELDVHVLPSGNGREFVVWHGPELSNVFIDFGASASKSWRPADRSPAENDIRKWPDWQTLKDNAWVVHPDKYVPDVTQRDLRVVQRTPDRKLITLEDLLTHFPDMPMNIELKDSVQPSDIDRFIEILEAYKGNRPILVVSLSGTLLRRFKEIPKRQTYGIGFSALQAAAAIAKGWLPFNTFGDLRGYALQSSYARWVTPPRLIEKVHDAGGAVHVFLTAFTQLAPAIDATPNTPDQGRVSEILDRGVDGIMTDRPQLVRGLMDTWFAARSIARGVA